jgi:hypothetical protein
MKKIIRDLIHGTNWYKEEGLKITTTKALNWINTGIVTVRAHCGFVTRSAGNSTTLGLC